MSGPVDVLAVMDESILDCSWLRQNSVKTMEVTPEQLQEARAAVAELIETASFFVNDDRQRAWHSMYREPMGNLRAAIARCGGSK